MKCPKCRKKSASVMTCCGQVEAECPHWDYENEGEKVCETCYRNRRNR